MSSYIRTKRILLSLDTLKDIIAAHLYSMSAVNDDDDIDIDIKVEVDHSFPNLVPIKLTLTRKDNGS